jgi:hypothetical protein
MKAFSTPEYLSQCALRLRSADPKAWDEFCVGLDAYATEITVAVTAAEQNDILNQQGRAQMALHFLRMMRDCGKRPQQRPQQAQPSGTPFAG